mgnify:CR=1 FL=1
MRILSGKCGGMHSFPSNHAANGASLFVAFYQSLSPLGAVLSMLLLLVVGVSRIYLGVHYPLDILFGFFVGSFLAYILVIFFRRRFN